MIEGYVGLPGSGKSYTMTRRALQEMRRGHRVFANYQLDGAELFDPSEDLLYLPPGFIVLDEAHLTMSSRQFHKLPHSWMVKISQTRKSGWHLLWCAQHPMRVDKALRDITNWLWWCHCWPNAEAGNRPRIFWSNRYEPTKALDGDPRNPELNTKREIHRWSWKVARSYDTLAQLEGARHLLSDEDYDPQRAAYWEAIANEHQALDPADDLGPVSRRVVQLLRRTPSEPHHAESPPPSEPADHEGAA